MVKNHSTHSWLGGFVERLLQLRPRLGVASAVQYAVMSIHHAAELDPRRAAEIFVAANPVSRSTQPTRPARPAESPVARYRSVFGQPATAAQVR